MSVTYARAIAAREGVIQGGDLQPGDVVMRRCEGAAGRTAHAVATVDNGPSGVEVTYGDGCTGTTSYRMLVTLVALGSRIASQPLPDSRFYASMRAGHLARTGHELDALLTSTDGGMLWDITRKCCGGAE